MTGGADPYAASLEYFGRANGNSGVLGRLLYTDVKTYLVELLMKQDQMSMSTSIESRVPFLDHVLVEFAARLPHRLKLNGFTTKRILREAIRGLVPPEILTRRKMGFPVPFSGWVRGPWNSVAREVLLDRRTCERGLINPAAVETLLDEHRAGRRAGGDAIWALMNLELWYRTFIDGDGIQTLPDAGPQAGPGTRQRRRAGSALADQPRQPTRQHEDSRMRVSVFGLGYVGSVSAAAFAADGHDVVGVDVNADKVAAINEGRSPIVEPGLGELLQQGVRTRRLRATTSTADAVNSTDLSLVCVGTPSRRNGSLDLTYLMRVCEEIGTVLRDKPSYHVVVIRSTVLPGTTHGARDSGARADVGQEIRRGLRRLGESGVPARRHGAQGLPRAAAHAGRATTTPPTRRRPRRSTRTSRRRSSAPASATPR